MKLTLALMTCCVFSLHAAPMLGQSVTIDVKKASLEEVMHVVKKQTGYYFLLVGDESRKLSDLTIRAKEMALDKLMDVCLRNTGLGYSINDQTIVISPRGGADPNAAAQTQATRIIRGRVVDENGKPLIGATVIIKDSRHGTSVDARGEFRLIVPSVATEVVVNFIGYESKTVALTSAEVYEIVLAEDVAKIEGVVVTGIFANRAKESYTGAATFISKQEIEDYGSRNVIQTIANIDPAFYIPVDNISGSNPNKLPDIQIRGASNLPQNMEDLKEENRDALNVPLIIKDGFEISLQALMDLNENVVENITLLKDAAATAYYGSRGANGVIVITTKLPEEGNLRVTYRGKMTLETPDLSDYRLLDARRKLDLEYRAGYYNYPELDGDISLKEFYALRKLAVEQGVDTYWLSQPLRTALPNSHSLSIDGGSKSFRYLVSAGYDRRNGVMKNSYRDIVDGNITLTYYHKKLVFRNSAMVGITTGQESNYGSFDTYARMNPYLPIYNDEGKLYRTYPANRYYRGGLVTSNPLYIAMLDERNSEEVLVISNNFSLEWNATETLRATVRAGICRTSTENHKVKPGNHPDYDGYGEDRALEKGRYDLTWAANTNWNVDATIEYHEMFNDKHIINLGLNASMNQDKNRSYAAAGIGYAYRENYFGNALAYQPGDSPGGEEALVRNIGLLANVNYSFDNRYYVDASLRYDGNSSFGSNKRWGSFWSVGMGWNVHQEKFFNVLDPVFSYLKFRLSYGVTGSQGFSPYQAVMTYSYLNDDRYGSQVGVGVINFGNENLKWQKNATLNFGVETGFLSNRIMVNFDVYKSQTDNLLASINMAPSTGFASYKQNVGTLENKGLEMRVTGMVIRNSSKRITWSITGSMARNTNKLVKLSKIFEDESDEIMLRSISPDFLFREGESMNAIYAVRSLGINPATGTEVFLRPDGSLTDTWDAAYKVACGTTEPKLRGSINTSFRYRDLILTASFSYRLGAQRYNNTFADKIERSDYYSNVDRRVYEDRWKEAGDNTKFKSIFDTGGTGATSRFVQTERMFQFNTFSVRYDLAGIKSIKQALKVQKLELGFQTVDLLYFSSIKRERGISYPFSRRYTFMLSAHF
ncbi:SusC/RagA family TonB-linked outer membrane protein [Alistipes sp. OttesenSCG-928-B03]|nr:SusC/RagA family TonB-linked outer membrane protein [Alistipes sp. OttesenSCG-928-B03]